jgi:AcrR family transcriptional regulator
MKERTSASAIPHAILLAAGLIAAIDRRPYKKVAREQSQQRTRDALLDAADDEFYSDRWQKTSLEALSAKAGVTKQTLLRHFGSKDGLLLQALMRGAAQILEQRWSTPPGDVAGAVENLLDHYESWGERSLRIGAWQRSGPAMLAKLSQMARQVHYEWVEYAFGPWLQGLDEEARVRRRAALIAVCDVQSWWIFSHDLRLERSVIHATLTDTIERLLAERPEAAQRSGATQRPGAKPHSGAKPHPEAKKR